jgi:rare lipoprotein A (peptidoglycan hydrolase)
MCGKCIEVKGPKGSVVVKVLDKCPECKKGAVDLSKSAFEKIADVSAGRVPSSWVEVPCSGGSNDASNNSSKTLGNTEKKQEATNIQQPPTANAVKPSDSSKETEQKVNPENNNNNNVNNNVNGNVEASTQAIKKRLCVTKPNVY